MSDLVFYWAKAVGVLLAASFAWVFSVVDPVASWISGAATLAGVAVLIWRLVVDQSVERNIMSQYDQVIKEYERLIEELTRQNARLLAELESLRAGGDCE